MATTYLKFTGPCKWAKILNPDKKYNNYQIQVYLDKVTKEAYQKSGIQVQIKNDDDGEYVTFRRPVQKIIKGQLVDLGKPRLVDKNDAPTEVLVGNGSIVQVTVAVYDTVKGRGHTLMEVRIIDLVKYEGKDG